MKSFVKTVAYLLGAVIRSAIMLASVLLINGAASASHYWDPSVLNPDALFVFFVIGNVSSDVLAEFLWRPLWRVTRPAVIEGLKQGLGDANVDEDGRPRRI